VFYFLHIVCFGFTLKDWKITTGLSAAVD